MFYLNHFAKPIKNYYFFALLIGAFVSCEQSATSINEANLVSTDLGQYGIPVTIQIPKSSAITESNYSHEKGLLVLGEGFDMRIDAFTEMADSSHNAKRVKQEVLAERKSEDDFKRLVVDDSTGFIYETVDKELGSNYHFFYVKMKGDVQVEFREGIPKEDNFSLENITQMYNSVQNR